MCSGIINFNMQLIEGYILELFLKRVCEIKTWSIWYGWPESSYYELRTAEIPKKLKGIFMIGFIILKCSVIVTPGTCRQDSKQIITIYYKCRCFIENIMKITTIVHDDFQSGGDH